MLAITTIPAVNKMMTHKRIRDEYQHIYIQCRRAGNSVMLFFQNLQLNIARFNWNLLSLLPCQSTPLWFIS